MLQVLASEIAANKDVFWTISTEERTCNPVCFHKLLVSHSCKETLLEIFRVAEMYLIFVITYTPWDMYACCNYWQYLPVNQVFSTCYLKLMCALTYVRYAKDEPGSGFACTHFMINCLYTTLINKGWCTYLTFIRYHESLVLEWRRHIVYKDKLMVPHFLNNHS